MITLRLVVGLAFSSIVGVLAYQRKSLARSGIAGAVITGTMIFGLGGIVSGLLLITFFVTSSVLSHYKAMRKQIVAQQFEKGGQRDLAQALANGGAAAFFAACSGAALLQTASTAVVAVCFAGLAGALATANADTWATELGVLSRTHPRMITHPLQVVAPGTSGGVTSLGLLAAVGGALLIGLVNLLLQQLSAGLFSDQPTPWLVLYNWAPPPPTFGQAVTLLVAALIGGVAGTLIDSLLGATCQAIYFSERRQKQTEKRVERDGTPNRLLRGWTWLNNDWVNFISTLCGAAISALLVSLAYPIFVA